MSLRATPDIDRVIADALQIGVSQVSDALGYQDIRQWDSLGHAKLMLALEQAWDATIDEELSIALTSVAAIRAAHQDRSVVLPRRSLRAQPGALARGLDGIEIDETRLSEISGGESALRLCGYGIEDLLEHATFEEVAYLLLHQELPDGPTRSRFMGVLDSHRDVPATVLATISVLQDAHPLHALRTAVSVLGGLRERTEDAGADAARLIGMFPSLVGVHHACRSGRTWHAPDPGLSHAERVCWAILGQPGSAMAIEFIDRDLIMHAEHGANASTFVARIVTGCGADMAAAVVAALAAFAGSRHGGAVEEVTRSIDAIRRPERAAEYVEQTLTSGGVVPGFGHRIYKRTDPRVPPMRSAVWRLARDRGDTRDVEIVDALAEAMRAYARHGLVANVDLYAGVGYRLLGVPDDLATCIFALGRVAGWTAHAIEQRDNNILIRPHLRYVGARPRQYAVPVT